MKLNMTVEEALEFADEWSRGMTLHEGSQGWRVVCMLLAQEVRRMRGAEKLTEEQRKEFECLTLPVIKWLNENGNPHVTVAIDQTSAVLNEGISGITSFNYLRD